MLCVRKIARLVGIMLLFHFVFPRNAYAYLDPATGNYILQIVLAVLVGGLFAVKHYYGKIGDFFANLFSKGKAGSEDDGER